MCDTLNSFIRFVYHKYVDARNGQKMKKYTLLPYFCSSSNIVIAAKLVITIHTTFGTIISNQFWFWSSSFCFINGEVKQHGGVKHLFSAQKYMRLQSFAYEIHKLTTFLFGKNSFGILGFLLFNVLIILNLFSSVSNSLDSFVLVYQL